MSSDIIIRKQKFKIKTSGEQQAHDIRRMINDELQYKLLQVYEDALGSLDKDVYAEKIVINLGKMTMSEFFVQLPERIIEDLQKQLRTGGQLQEIVQESFEGKMKSRENQINFLSKEEKLKWEKLNNPELKQTDNVQAVIYFLEKGMYPWWYAGKQRKTPEALLSFSPAQTERLLIKIAGILKSATGQKAETVKKRLVQQLDEALFKNFIDVFAHLLGNDNSMSQNLALLTSNETIPALAGFFSVSVSGYRKMLTAFLLDVISEKRELSIKVFLLALKENATKYFNKNFQSETESAEFKRKTNIEFLLSNPALKKIVETGKEILTQTTGLAEEEINATAPKQGPGSVFSEEEGIYISNVGIVILHPFLTALFKELNLLDEKDQFISTEHCRRAVILLHYLQTGKEEYEEQHLAFSKIVSGMKPEDNLPDDIILTENEKAECDQLLDIVIGYWEALKGASREALRETFFNRNGKLSYKDEMYLLEVERNATDILIDRLPWGIGIVKFPWLGSLIHVKW